MSRFPKLTTGIFNICSNLKNSNSEGKDGVPNKFLRFFIPTISEKSVILINRCMLEKYFPKSLKIARLAPLFKSGDKQDPSNCRSISVLASLSKIVDRIRYTKLENFQKTTKRRNPRQFGFRKKLPTVDALISTTEYR